MSLPLRRLGFFSFCALFLAVILSTLATVSAQSAPDSSTPESSFASQNPRGIPALADADGFQETSRRRLRRPHISEVKPDKAHQGQTNLNVAVTGQYTHFAQGTTTASFGTGITLNSVTVADSTHVTVNLSVDAMATVGNRNVTLTTGSEVVTLSNGFAVGAGTPVITQVNPNTGQQGQSNLNVAITGQYTHFVQGTTTASFGAGITINSVTVSSATAATVNLSVDPGATVGNRNVTLTTGSEVVTLSNGFAVGAGTPVITQVSLEPPSSLPLPSPPWKSGSSGPRQPRLTPGLQPLWLLWNWEQHRTNLVFTATAPTLALKFSNALTSGDSTFLLDDVHIIHLSKQRPSLGVQLTTGAVRIFWPIDPVSSFKLQTALDPAGLWTDSNLSVQTEGTNNVVSVPLTNARASFYRLKQ